MSDGTEMHAGNGEEVRWSRLTAAEIAARNTPETVVIIPVASTEQHGPHLPTGVDAVLAEEVSVRTAGRLRSLGGEAIVTPCMWVGLAEHHMSIGGTFTLDVPTFRALVGCLVRSVVRHGFRRIALVNGHGGNMELISVCAGELTQELGLPVVATSYWVPAAARFGTILERQANVLHAGEAETSMMMAAAPDLVNAGAFEAAVPPSGPVTGSAGNPVVHRRPFARITPTGVLGDPRVASAPKGEALLDAAAEMLAQAFADPGLWSEDYCPGGEKQ